MPEAPLPFSPPAHATSASPRRRDQATADGDREMMRDLLSGSDDGFTRFYRRFSPGLFSMVYQILQDQKESEDVLQESFVQMWKKSSSYDSTRSSLFTWAVMISRNRAIDRLRARQRRTRTAEAFTAETEVVPASPPVSGEEALSAADDRLRVRSAIATLPEAQRQAIELAFFGGLTQAQISAKLETPLGTVKARIRRGLLALRDSIRPST
ncbi:MAG: sigma-70 family RNA polymerase sigma factor [Verrucomicrobiota bacterium]|nr:sigma-70 family RNA polymerase sigma factor [Verrucomicrobiota bacterium]